jgi:hypothetical protein
MMFSRRGAAKKKKAAREFVFPAPIMGLVRTGTLIGGDPSACEVLDNFIPTAEGARLRGGSVKHATLDGGALQLMRYRSGAAERIYAATASKIFDVTTPADPDTTPIAAITGLSGGDWSFTQFATSGGQFLIAANGTDPVFVYDGSTWNPRIATSINQLDYDGLTAAFVVGETVSGGGRSAPIVAIYPSSATAGKLILGTITGGHFVDNDPITSASGAAVANGASSSRSSLAITGVATDDLSFVWQHKRRLWFVEAGTLSAWYLPVNSIAGTAVEFPLDGVFRLGGSLMFGGTWSQDSGDGLDDYAVFVTTEGEIAVYQGTDPETAADWSLVGVYVIGRPLRKTAWFRGGGDLVILTEDGAVPVSEALMKDRAALQAASITAPIEDLWKTAIANRVGSFSFSVALWSTQTAIFISTPDVGGGTRILVANTRNGRWATISGWDMQCSIISNDRLYFGTSAGLIVQGDVQGADMGAPYTGTWVPKFQELQTGDTKVACHARVLTRAVESASPRVAVFANYEIGQYPVEGVAPQPSASVWGTMVWGSFIWGGSTVKASNLQWQSVSGMGFSLAPAIVAGSNSTAKPTLELLGCVLRYEVGRSI